MGMGDVTATESSRLAALQMAAEAVLVKGG